MYRIAVLTSSRAQEAFLAEQISRFCAEHCLFPKMDCYHDQESFFEAARNEPLTNALIALPGARFVHRHALSGAAIWIFHSMPSGCVQTIFCWSR